MPGGAVISGQSRRRTGGGAQRPVTWRAAGHVAVGSPVISPGAGSRDEGQEHLRRAICLRPSSQEYQVFTDSSDLLKETVEGVAREQSMEIKSNDMGSSSAFALTEVRSSQHFITGWP